MFTVAEFLLVKQNIIRSVAEFIDSDWEDKVNSGVGLSYRAARLHGQAGLYDNSMPELTLSPQSGIHEFGGQG